jgi:hypothetical protein
MREDPIARMLSSDEALAPSAGFAGRVMDAVQQAAAEPPPLAFPWARFVLGLITILVSAGSSVWLFQRLDISAVLVRLTDMRSELGWATATIVGTLALVWGEQLRRATRRLFFPRAPWNTPF